MERVSIGSLAYSTIAYEALASEDGRETGGLLLGARTFSWQALRIVDATGPGPNATRARTEFLPDAAHDLDVEQRYLRVLGGEGARLGHWHTHSAGSGTPSPADLQAWHTWCEMLDDARSVGVIVTPDRDRGWHRPHLDGWVLQRRDDGLCSICRPVALEVRR